MFKVFVAVLALFFGNFTFAKAPSALRPSNQSWKISKQKFEFQELLKFKIKKDSDSVLDSAVAYDKVDINLIPEFQKSTNETQRLFEEIRNIRFLEDPDLENFSRRISWLYPIDGCFARAEWVAHLLKKSDPNIQFGRVFIFGDLKVDTQNSEYGYVTWWYHVAVIIRLQGKAYVFDPSLALAHPIELSEWVKLQVPDPSSDAKLAICSGSAYDPGSDCNQKSLLSDEDAAAEIVSYLRAERSNLIRLGRDVDVELADNPPW